MSTVEIPMTMRMVMDYRNQGKSWEFIAEKFNKSADEIFAEYQQFMASRQTHTESEYRMIQLNRLEKMIDALYDGMNTGSVDHVKAMLPVVKEISKLLDLHQEKTRVEVRVVEQKQVEVIVNYVQAVTETIQSQVLKTVTAKKARETIEQEWDDWVAQASAAPLKQIESAKVEV